MNIILGIVLIGLAYGAILGSIFIKEDKPYLIGFGVGLARIVILAVLGYGFYLLIN